MKRCKVTEEEIMETKRRLHKELEMKDTENAKTIPIEKKGDFLRIGNTLINLKNVDVINCDSISYNFDNVKIVDLHGIAAIYQEGMQIIIERIMEVL